MFTLTALLATLCIADPDPTGDTVKIRLATLAPEGSTWMNAFNEMANEVREKTGGAVEFQIYPGGVAGDEKLVVKKLRIGQVHAAALTGMGLGDLLPEVRILDIPFLYRNHQETDRVRGALCPRFEKSFLDKGYVVLGWSDAGTLYLFSGGMIRNIPELRARKVWVWEGDTVAEVAFRTVGVGPIPLAFTDVMTSLQTGLIDTVYIPPIGAIALQWFSKVKTMTDLPLLDVINCLLVSKKVWDKIPADQQKNVLEVTRKHSLRLVDLTRKENDTSIKVLQEKGIQIVKPDDSTRPELERVTVQTSRGLVGKLYTQDLLDEVLKLLDEMRANK